MSLAVEALASRRRARAGLWVGEGASINGERRTVCAFVGGCVPKGQAQVAVQVLADPEGGTGASLAGLHQDWIGTSMVVDGTRPASMEVEVD